MNDDISALLEKTYYDASTGFTNERRLYDQVKPLNPQITHKIVTEWLQSQEVAQVHKQRLIKNKTYYPLTAYQPFKRVQVDLLDVSNENPTQNEQTKFLFICICVYTRFVIIHPQTNKTETQCMKSLEVVSAKVQKMGFKLSQLDSDSESAFLSKSFKTYFQKHNIDHNVSRINDHNSLGIVDRFCRTIRGLIAKYQTAMQTQKYIVILPKLVENYNTTKHSTLNKTPEEALTMGGIDDYVTEKVSIAAKQPYNMVQFPINTKVRIIIKRKQFEKAGNRWSTTLHTIEREANGLYYVKDRVGGYRKNELQLVTGAVQTAPQRIEVSNLEERKENQVIEKRITRRIAKEGIERFTPEVKIQPRVRRQTDHGPFLFQ